MVMLLSPTASGAAVSCTYSPGDHLLTVTTPRGFAQITRSGDTITVGDFLKPPIGCAGGTPTVTNTDRVFLRHTSELDSATDIYLSGGPFAPGATAEPDSSSEIEFDFADDGEVEVHGTAGPDLFAWGPADGLNLNFDLNGDRDVDVIPSPFKDGFIVASGGPGDDVITSQPDYTGFGVFSEGGPGNDSLIAPREGGILEGGSGKDTIVGGGFDMISGGPGKDVIRAGKGGDEIDATDGTKDRVSCGKGRDSVKADRVDRLHGCEHVVRAGKRHKSRSATVAAATREEYIAQADPICQATIEAQRNAAGPGPTTTRLLKHGRLKAAGHRLERIFQAFAPGVEELAALEPPAQDAPLIATWIAMLRSQVPLGLKAANALIHKKFPAKLLARLGSLNARTQDSVVAYGFQVCNSL